MRITKEIDKREQAVCPHTTDSLIRINAHQYARTPRQNKTKSRTQQQFPGFTLPPVSPCLPI